MPYMKKRGKKMQLNMTGIYTKLYAITDHTPCDVDTPKRLGAYIVDWVVGGIFTGLPAVLLYSGLTKKQDMFGGLYVFESLGYARGWAFLAGALCILFALFYFVYVPWRIWPGQTLGKHIAGYRIEKNGWYSSGFAHIAEASGYRWFSAGGGSICRIELYPAASDAVLELLCRLLLADCRDDPYSVVPYSCDEN